jgi:hypothetical protein
MRGWRVNEESVRISAVQYESYSAALTFHKEENTLDASGIGGERDHANITTLLYKFSVFAQNFQ